MTSDFSSSLPLKRKSVIRAKRFTQLQATAENL
jgi:hypothetical protein